MTEQKKVHESGTDVDRRTLSEILITAVVFGFTLNIISDFILSLPILLANPLLLLWYAGWSIVSLIITLYLLYRLFSLYLGDDSTIRHEFKIALIWDAEKGTIARRPIGYRPQIDATDIFETLEDKSIEEMKQIIIAGPEALQENTLHLQLAEILMLTALSRNTSAAEGFDSFLPRRIDQILQGKNLFATPEIAAKEIRLLGKCDIIHIVNDDSKRIFRFKWRSPFHGSSSIEIETEKVDWFTDVPDEKLAIFDNFYETEFFKGMGTYWKLMKDADPRIFSILPELIVPERKQTKLIRSDIKVKFQAKFSPLYVQFNWKNTKVMLPWMKNTIAALLLVLDWQTYLLVIRETQKLNTRLHRRSQDYF